MQQAAQLYVAWGLVSLWAQRIGSQVKILTSQESTAGHLLQLAHLFNRPAAVCSLYRKLTGAQCTNLLPVKGC